MTKRLSKLFGIAFLASTLAACNGASGDNEETDPLEDLAPVTSIIVEVLDGNCEAVDGNAFVVGDTVCVQATLTQDDVLTSGEIIAFSADIGELSAATKLTDANGIAQVTLDSSNANVGAGVLSATFDGAVGSVNYEFLSAQETDATLSSISVNLLDSEGNPITRFQANDVVQVRAVLLDSNADPIENQIVSFQASSGELSVDQALTNANGLAQASLTPSESDLGAASLSVTFNDNDTVITDSVNYEVQAAGTVNDSIVRIGHFENGVFIENVLGFAGTTSSDDVTISAGATLGVRVDVVDENDQAINLSTPVTFTSVCVQADKATLDDTVNTINGTANATYKDISCAGGAGNDDTIAASVTINSTTLTVARDLSLSAESVGSIAFLSASPESIVLQGTGGQGSESVSTLTFQVNGAEGNPLAQQTVRFSLNTSTGDLSLSPATGLTNSEGQVSVKVTAGNVPTSVRVTAEVDISDTETLQTQSDLLTVNTGLPDQNSFSLSFSNLNPEAFSQNGEQVTVTASLADTFNNPVPDGTAVSFTTEGGSIEPSCLTTSGVCSVVWTSSNPRPSDGRVTILATAIGHETLVDSNGNNVYDDADGAAITSNNGSGLDFVFPSRSGFVDLSEAWRDDNENRVKDSNEVFLDFDNSGVFEGQNGLFDGPQCTGSACGEASLHVRSAQVLVMSQSAALISVSTGGVEVANNSTPSSGTPVASIVREESLGFTFTFSDTANQPIPSGSTISVNTNAGTLSGQTSFTMPQTNQEGSRSASFRLTNSLVAGDPATDATLSVTITSPSGLVSQVFFLVTLL
ncbi:Ig-like domain-containing protein [Alteromonas sp. W364]|uniref:Ig-like domain-containing protein n=1 Tax=Alteromonas sp. W364 TaxID=3075610 RepID=UPI002886E502|nr:Ig-like domain-containing protein [Alteromonas sp. W364]MDT0629374.1 Ig-like protein, group 1 [Alteromonas sp. W364]